MFREGERSDVDHAAASHERHEDSHDYDERKHYQDTCQDVAPGYVSGDSDYRQDPRVDADRPPGRRGRGHACDDEREKDYRFRAGVERMNGALQARVPVYEIMLHPRPRPVSS